MNIEMFKDVSLIKCQANDLPILISSFTWNSCRSSLLGIIDAHSNILNIRIYELCY